MRRLYILVCLLLASVAGAQLLPGVSRTGRADLDSVSPGYAVIPTLSEGVTNNRIYTDGTQWEAGTDSFPPEFDDGFTRQVVTVSADAASTSSTYWTLEGRQAQDVYVCRPDSATTSHSSAFSGWTDTGLDVIRFDDTYSCLTKSFPAGSYNVPGCASDASQCILFVRNQTAALPQPSRGVIQFTQSSLTVDEGDTINFSISRTGGSTGVCEGTVTEGTGASNGVLVSTSPFTWASGESSTQNGTATAGSVSGDQTYVLNLGTITGCSAGARTALTVTIIDTDTTPAAQEYFVDAGSGSDSNNGTSAGTAWATIGRANAVQPVAGGDVVIWLEDQGAGCDYRDDPYIPANSGTDSTHRIILKPRSGDVRLCGPTSGSLTYAMRFNDGIDHIEVQEDSGNRIEIYGEVVFGTSSGEAQKCVSTCTSTLPDAVARITQGVLIAGDDIVLDYDHSNTAGWGGVVISSSADRPIIRMNGSQHGTPFYTGNADWGDMVATSSGAALKDYLIDGGSTGRTFDYPGHAHLGFFGGRVLVRGLVMDGSWGDVATFSNTNPDGDRLIFYHRNASEGYIHDVIVNRNGKGKDQSWQECIKLEGTENGITTSVIRNCHFAAIRSDEATWSNHARRLRYSHLTIDGAGVLVDAHDWSQFPGDSVLEDIRGKNILMRRMAPNIRDSGTYDDTVLHISFDVSGWQNQTSWDGVTIEDTRSCTELYIDIDGPGAPNKQTIQYYLNNYPNNFSDWTCTTDANLDNAPSSTADSNFTNWETHWTPVSDSLSVGAGVDLTNASSAGTNSTNLCVDDALWFPDPQSFPAPDVGQFDGGYQVHIGGVGNVTYTDRTLTNSVSAGASSVGSTTAAGCLTLSSAQTWSDNAPVNLKISAGGANAQPNRGAIL